MTMRLSEEIKSKIRAEYEGWFESQYGNLSAERRKELVSSFETKGFLNNQEAFSY